ncbi:MAG TPA: O-antigen ligase family protein [Longimicrobiales bacterium]|nr:O-antigen ligase family protein [Longimicrobiales bacterium]
MIVEPWSRRAVALLYAAVIAGYPLVSGLPLVLGVDSRVASVPFRAFVLLYSIALFVGVSIVHRRAYRGLYWIPFILFWVLYIVRLFLDIVFLPVTLRLTPAEYFAYSLGMCMITGIVMLMRVDDDTLRLAFRATFGAVVISCLTALYLNVAAILSGDLSSLQNMRLQSETLNPVGLGNLGVSLMLLSMFMLLHRLPRSVLATLALLALVLIGLATTGMAASRGPVLAFVLALPVLVWLGIRRGAWVRALALAGAVIVTGISAAVYIQQTLGFGIISRISSALDFGSDESSNVRVALYRGAWDQFVHNPILGSSLDERISTFHPHNPWIESFMATGFLGGTAFSLLLLAAFIGALRILRDMPEHGWLPLLFGQYTLHGLLSGALYLSADMWGLMSAMVAIGFASSRAPATPGSPSAGPPAPLQTQGAQ